MIKILGIDPGLNITGWGVIRAENRNSMSFVDAGFIKTDAKEDLAIRLQQIYHGLDLVVEKHKPDEAAIEETFVNKNPLSSLKLGHARAASILVVALRKIEIKEYAATLVKKTVVGVGRAEKDQVKMMVKTLLPGAKIDIADAADALAVAICHLIYRSNVYDR